MIGNSLTFQRQLWPEKKPIFRSEFGRKIVHCLCKKLNWTRHENEKLRAYGNKIDRRGAGTKIVYYENTFILNFSDCDCSWSSWKQESWQTFWLNFIFLWNNTISWFIQLSFLSFIQFIRFIQWYFNKMHYCKCNIDTFYSHRTWSESTNQNTSNY